MVSSIDIVQRFLQHVFAGEMDQALGLTTDETKYISTRPVPDVNMPTYGTFIGYAGAQHFFGQFAEMLVPGDFVVESAFSEGEHVAMYGSLCHLSRHTGKEFASDWAMICRVKEGRIALYHFYEDTAALERAIHP